MDWPRRVSFLLSSTPSLHNCLALLRIAEYERCKVFAICLAEWVGHSLMSVLISSSLQGLTSVLIAHVGLCCARPFWRAYGGSKCDRITNSRMALGPGHSVAIETMNPAELSKLQTSAALVVALGDKADLCQKLKPDVDNPARFAEAVPVKDNVSDTTTTRGGTYGLQGPRRE